MGICMYYHLGMELFTGLHPLKVSNTPKVYTYLGIRNIISALKFNLS
jgi:hypothetical protein